MRFLLALVVYALASLPAAAQLAAPPWCLPVPGYFTRLPVCPPWLAVGPPRLLRRPLIWSPYPPPPWLPPPPYGPPEAMAAPAPRPAPTTPQPPAAEASAGLAELPPGTEHPAFAGGIDRHRPLPVRETVAGDRAFQGRFDLACEQGAEVCSQLRDRQPPCLAYRNFAALYFRLRAAGTARPLAERMWRRIKAEGKYTDEFYDRLRDLFELAYRSGSPGSDGGSPQSFAAAAYKACMQGRPLAPPQPAAPPA